MLWSSEILTEIKLQDILDAIVALLKKIFGFVADEEGWVEEEVAE